MLLYEARLALSTEAGLRGDPGFPQLRTTLQTPTPSSHGQNKVSHSGFIYFARIVLLTKSFLLAFILIW